MDIILPVRRVGFHGHTEDSRSPEDFPFPACMTSLMEYLGEDVRWETHSGHGREWTQRFLNKEILIASGMGFGLLWSPEHCQSIMDLTQVHDHTIQKAFDYCGYDFQIMVKTADNTDNIKTEIVKALDQNIPVLAFGLIGPPECCILCGYERDGEVLIGWSHFADFIPCDRLDNGMFRIENGYENLWQIVWTGSKKEKSVSLRDIIARGVGIMQQTQREGYLAGEAAYDAWIEFVLDDALASIDDEVLAGRYSLHHGLVGNHAEARCYLGNFLMDRADGDERIAAAAQCFSDIHDICWKVWGACGGWQAPKDGFRSIENRQAVAALLREIKTLDQKALQLLKDWLG